jgi:hypothetical protein
MQGRGPARLVGDPDVHSVRELHYLDNSLHRRGKELRKGCWFCDWFDFAAVYFLSDPRLRQRAVSRPFGFARGRGFSAAASLLRPPAKRAGCRLRGATACQGKPPFLDLTPRESSVPKVPDAALRVSPLRLAGERTKVRGWLSETLS